MPDIFHLLARFRAGLGGKSQRQAISMLRRQGPIHHRQFRVIQHRSKLRGAPATAQMHLHIADAQSFPFGRFGMDEGQAFVLQKSGQTQSHRAATGHAERRQDSRRRFDLR